MKFPGLENGGFILLTHLRKHKTQLNTSLNQIIEFLFLFDNTSVEHAN